MAPATRISRVFRCASVALLALFAATHAPTAHAEPSKEELQVARTLFGQALAEENQERWAQALAKLESVQAIKASPAVRFHIALCEEKLGRLAAALSDYEAARVAARNENSKEVLAMVEEPIARLTAEVPHVTLLLEAPPPGATIQVDGRTLAAVGFGVAIPLDPGTHQIVVSAPGRVAFAHTVVLRPRSDVGLQIALLAEAVAAPVAPPREPVRIRHPLRPYAVLTSVGAVVTLGAGLGMIFGSGAVLSSKEGSCLPRSDCGPVTTVQVLDWAGLGSLIAAGGLTVASVVLWTRPGTRDATARAVHTQIGAAPGRLVLQGTFE